MEIRREWQFLIMLYKMKNKHTPESLSNQLPATISNRNQYSIRDTSKLTSIKTRSNQHFQSFLPATITLWNKLDKETSQAKSLEQFKSAITRNITKPLDHYNLGDRKEQILHYHRNNKALPTRVQSKPNCTTNND